MCREELLAMIARWPFKPFRLTMSDRNVFEIWSPQQTILTLSALIVGLANRDEAIDGYPIMERYVVIDLLHITRIEEL